MIQCASSPSQPFAENVANEGFGPKRGEVLVEGENVDALDARFENAQHLVVEGGDAREDFVGLVKEFSGMRLERHAGGLEAPVGRGLHDAPQKRLVPRVHAVEVADGERRGTPQERRGKAAENSHERSSRRKKEKRSSIVSRTFAALRGR